ncbi:MAG: hypothetical protein AABZ06_04295 [Bdellovibrionota bacterium]
MLPCKEIVRLISSGEYLPLIKKAELRMHLMMCKHCSRYSKHLLMLSDAFRKLFAAKTKMDQTQVESLKKQVLEEIDRKKR